MIYYEFRICTYYREEILEAAAREVLEETGLKLKNLKQTDLVNAVWPAEKYHYVIIVTQGEIDETHQDEPVNLEPHKCEGVIPPHPLY